MATGLLGHDVQAREPTLDVPVRFHIVRDLTMTAAGVELRSWVTAGDIQRTVLPEVNRIWQDAGIAFRLAAVDEARVLDPPDRERLIADISNAKRDAQGKSDPERIKKLSRLIDLTTEAPNTLNIYVVPYLGHTSQGNASRRKRRIFVTQWSDKKVDPGRPPERFRLVEPGTFRRGSFSRTVAHELGHVLGLRHPNKADQVETGLLMGGKRPGYRLTADEIRVARQHAQRLAQR